MADSTEKNSKKQKRTKAKTVESTFLSKTSKPEKKGRMKMKGKRKGRDNDQRKRRGGGPRLPNVLRQELGLDVKRNSSSESDSEGGEDVRDFYELDEEVAQEESGKNRRFDEVENYQYELPDDFEDEEVPSDEGEDDSDKSEVEDEREKEDGERHLRMLQDITGIPKEAFDGEKKKREEVLLSQADVRSEIVTIHDLLVPLQGMPGYSSLRKRVLQQEKQPMTLQAPLPKSERDKVQRKVSDKFARKEITKWEGVVKRNREAPTLFFEQDQNLGYSTVGAIASGFEPRTEFEKQMAQLRQDPELVEAYKNDGAKMLELNKVSVKDVIDRQNRLAKMRSLLFRHEMKAKRIKKIKSKTYHKIKKKERQKAASAELEMNPEAAKQQAIKQEQKRAEERLTLKHKNSSKWAKRILKRGLDVQDDATRAAIAEQLQKHEELKRKMNSMNNNESSTDEESSDDDDEEEDESKRALKALNKAKEKTAKVLEEGDEAPKKGLFALPFMERGLKKRQEEAYEEARQALEDYDATLNQLQDEGEEGEEETQQNSSAVKVTGKRTFGPAKKPVAQEYNKRKRLDDFGKDSDSEEEDGEFDEPVPQIIEDKNDKTEGVQLGTALLDEEQVMAQHAIFRNLDDMEKAVGPKTSYEVAIFAGDSFRKVRSDSGHSNKATTSSVIHTSKPSHETKETDQSYETDSDTEMVEGFLTTNLTTDQKPDYELPSQAELVRRVFAGDDVAAEFERDKLETLNEENPEPEKPALVPGWGQWTHVQKKKGLPDWMVREHEEKKRKRGEALKKRKDAKFDHVIISETINRKAEKLMATSLPFPFTSKEAYEGNMRMPIGPDFNPASALSALNRPEIIKKPGLIIQPIEYEEVDPDETNDQPKRIIQGAKPKQSSKEKSKKGKSSNKLVPKTLGQKVKST
ncbi:U3 small nucleolar RNA-associated protein 14 [Rhynchospora pubera]|uniref:U3 small nucleolar RNA-associated protein 14 n=1 Tax=Rhynchospora pubera TaxID=906938 RepID=A0AAV8BX84_9POAL|nr:U3 small nucleolar RNA-associated protein 14 [Rhynchospora pubera]